MIEIVITPADLAESRNEGSVIVLTGTDAETGERVTFAGDHRPMIGLIDAVMDSEDGQLTAAVEPWQVLGRNPA